MVENDFRPEYLAMIFEQGIEMERLKLQVQQSTKSESIESHVRIFHGERFLSVLTVVGVG